MHMCNVAPNSSLLIRSWHDSDEARDISNTGPALALFVWVHIRHISGTISRAATRPKKGLPHLSQSTHRSLRLVMASSGQPIARRTRASIALVSTNSIIIEHPLTNHTELHHNRERQKEPCQNRQGQIPEIRKNTNACAHQKDNERGPPPGTPKQCYRDQPYSRAEGAV
jgi:hypothetical protein